MFEYVKVDAPTDFPAMCVCGAQKPPLVDTNLVKVAYGHVYLCRLCVMRSARALGLIKGDEQTRLQNAADELIYAASEVESRQQIIDRQAIDLAQREQRIAEQQELIVQLRGDLKLSEKQIRQIAEMAAA